MTAVRATIKFALDTGRLDYQPSLTIGPTTPH